jgi:hypothetical protein
MDGSCPGLLIYFNCIFLESLRKTTAKLGHYNRYFSRDLNVGNPDLEAGMLSTWP